MLGTEPMVWSYVSSGSRRSHRGTRLLKPPDLRRGNKTSPGHPGARASVNLRLERFQAVCLSYGVPVAPRHRIRRSHGTLPGPRAHREGPGSLRATRGFFSRAIPQHLQLPESEQSILSAYARQHPGATSGQDGAPRGCEGVANAEACRERVSEVTRRSSGIRVPVEPMSSTVPETM
jgi:hypothetical protein